MPAKSPAQAALDKAEKKVNSSTGWFSSSSTKYEDAGDLYREAANAFKLEKQFKEAGDSFAREAECREKCKERHEASNSWWEAAKSYKMAKPTNPRLAIEALQQCIVHLTQGGRFRQAADREKEVAQLYLGELEDIGKACESFVRAGDWYAQEDANATANACYKDAADLHARNDEFLPAINRYEQVANHSLGSALTKYSVKDYWLKAGLCALATGDPTTAKVNLDKYTGQDRTFATTRESKFLRVLIEAYETEDEKMFMDAVAEFDQVTTLDDWKTSILLKIKKRIQEQEADLR